MKDKIITLNDIAECADGIFNKWAKQVDEIKASQANFDPHVYRKMAIDSIFPTFDLAINYTPLLKDETYRYIYDLIMNMWKNDNLAKLIYLMYKLYINEFNNEDNIIKDTRNIECVDYCCTDKVKLDDLCVYHKVLEGISGSGTYTLDILCALEEEIFNDMYIDYACKVIILNTVFTEKQNIYKMLPIVCWKPYKSNTELQQLIQNIGKIGTLQDGLAAISARDVTVLLLDMLEDNVNFVSKELIPKLF